MRNNDSSRFERTMLGRGAWAAGTCLLALSGCSSAAGVGKGSGAHEDPVGTAQEAITDTLREDTDSLGQIESDSTNAFAAGSTNGFFASLGTNGRTCNSCHVENTGWTITPGGAQELSPFDPLFAPVDGSDCPPTRPNQGPNALFSSEVLNYALIRIQIGIPAGADFSLVSATNPKRCAVPPGSSGVGGQLFLFRRPLPSTNLVFDSSIMWDGRETLEKLTTQAGEQSEGPLLFDLADQANGATTGHAQGSSIAGTQAQTDIVAFELNLFTAQSRLQNLLTVQSAPSAGASSPQLLSEGVSLTSNGANGGAKFVADTLAPGFAIGVNDPLKPGFTNANFDIYRAWEPTSPTYASLKRSQQEIGRGEALFNNTTFTIHDVPGLNSSVDDPLYNPNDPLAGQDIVGGCAVCHNTPNVGNHSTSLPINIGITMAQPKNNDGSLNTVLDIANLPVYTLSNGTNSVAVTDPGRALISGHFVDAGKTKGPILRGLASRAPYFHNGSAEDLKTVVDFYNARFQIGLTDSQVSDLTAFLQAL